MDVSKWAKVSDAPIPERRNSLKGASPIGEALKTLAVGESFRIPVEIAGTIKDKAERAKALKESARKILSTISGTSRRISERDDAYAFVCRVGDDSSHVSIWRIDPANKEQRKPRKPKTPAAPASVPPVAPAAPEAPAA